MLVLPLVFFPVMKLLQRTWRIYGWLLLMTFSDGLPAINMVAMLSKKQRPDGDYAVCAVMMTTIACLITLPLVSLSWVMLALSPASLDCS